MPFCFHILRGFSTFGRKDTPRFLLTATTNTPPVAAGGRASVSATKLTSQTGVVRHKRPDSRRFEIAKLFLRENLRMAAWDAGIIPLNDAGPRHCATRIYGSSSVSRPTTFFGPQRTMSIRNRVTRVVVRCWAYRFPDSRTHRICRDCAGRAVPRILSVLYDSRIRRSVVAASCLFDSRSRPRKMLEYKASVLRIERRKCPRDPKRKHRGGGTGFPTVVRPRRVGQELIQSGDGGGTDRCRGSGRRSGS